MPFQERLQPTAGELAQMLEMREQGVCKTKIAEAIGRSQGVVFRWLDELDGIQRSRHRPKYGREEAHKNYGVYFDISKMEGVLKDG